MIVNELLHKRGNPLVGRGDFLVIAAGEHHRNDLVDACWAARETAARIFGLDVGADDFIEKPFSFPFLLSKIKATLRRNYDMAEEHKALTYKDIRVDLDEMTVHKGDRLIPVNGKELDILIYFLRNPDRVIRKEALFNAVWGSDCFSEISTLTVYIRWLREKIEDDPKEPKYIHTVWRVGYRFGEAES